VNQSRGHGFGEAVAFLYTSPMKYFMWLVVLLPAISAPLSAVAQARPPPEKAASPVGLWETIDDKTGKATAVVEIFEKEQKLFGRIEQILSGEDPKSVCVACTDDRKNQPIIGMIIIRSVKFSGPEYSGGDILDPDSGSVYRCKMHLEKNGSELIVRGYIGLSLFGRSQTWHRRT
jgi:uncharacterized protein (DUF2147 family)